MVECGGCDTRFRINDEVVIRTNKFYPGERNTLELSRFQRVPLSAGKAPPGMDTMRYQEFNNPEQLEPTSPQRIIAGIFGVSLMGIIGLLLLFSSSPGDAFSAMPIQNKLIIAGFVSLLGMILLVYANPRARIKALLVGLVIGTAVVSIPIFVKSNTLGFGEDDGMVVDRGFEPLFPEKEVDPLEALRERFITKPLEDEQERLTRAGSSGQAFGIFITGMIEQNKYTARDYLIRQTLAGVSSHLYPRDESNYLMILTGVEKDIEQVALIAGELGSTIEIYPEIGVIVVRVANEQFVAGSADKLNDNDNPAFYELNRRELQSIDLDRVKKAVERLSAADATIYRSDITKILTELLSNPGVTFHDSISRALLKWAEDPGPAADAALTVLDRYINNDFTTPESLVELVVKGKSPEAISTVVSLWVENPSLWDAYLIKFGTSIEPFVLEYLDSEAAPLRRSAVKLLGKAGSGQSLPPLKKLLDSEDPELRVLAERSIKQIGER